MRVIVGPEKKARMMSERSAGSPRSTRWATRSRPLPRACRPGPQDLDHRSRHGPRLRVSLPLEDRFSRRAWSSPARWRRRSAAAPPRRSSSASSRPEPRTTSRRSRRRRSAWSCVRHERRLGPRVFGHDPTIRSSAAIPLRTGLLGRDRPRDRRRDPPDHRGSPPARAHHPRRASRDARHGVGDPHPSRDDREGRVRGAAARHARVGGLPRGGPAAAAAGHPGRQARAPRRRARCPAPASPAASRFARTSRASPSCSRLPRTSRKCATSPTSGRSPAPCSVRRRSSSRRQRGAVGSDRMATSSDLFELPGDAS